MLIATLQLDHEAVALEQVFKQISEIQVEAERIAAHSTEWTMPCMWITGSESIREALVDDPSVKTVIQETKFSGEIHYQVEWSDTVQDRIDAYIDKGGSILKASATAEGWKLRMRFVDRDQFDSFRETLSELGCSYKLLELTRPDEPRISSNGLTKRQREALVTAWEHGYYNVPREISSDELASKLDISHQTLSELLRRGTEKVIKSQLVIP